MEPTFEKSVDELRALGLLGQKDVKILERVDSACAELAVPEYEAYIERRFNDQAVPILSKHGLMGLPIDEKYGGSGIGVLLHCLATERIGQLGMSLVTLVDVHQFLGSLILQTFGSEDQKSRILPEAASGKAILAYALTEPDAGSDPSAMTSEFEKEGSGFKIKGSKYLISNGSIAKYVILFAKSKQDGQISAFVVDSKTSGFNVAMHLSEKIGLFTSDTVLLEFDDMIVPQDALLGKLGKGLSIAYSALLNGRVGISSGCVGVMDDCLNACVERAKNRFQHKKLIGKHQMIQKHIARIATNLEASRWAVYMAALGKQKLDESPSNIALRNEVDRKSATAKLIASNGAFDSADRAVQVFGGFGYSLLSPVGKHFLDARATRIYEGTDEIMELKIASSILGKEFEAYS